MNNPFDVGDEITTLDHRRTGWVMDRLTDRTVMVQWDDEPFCRVQHTHTLTVPTYKTLVRAPKQRRSLLGAIAWTTAMGLLVATVMWLASTPAKAEPVTSSAPYGGCKEVVQDPAAMSRTEGAAWCRAHGWTIRPRLVVGPRGVVRYHTMPSCEAEDGHPLCSWNIRAGDGNGRGLAFWVDGRNHAHYVWRSNPARRNGWRWVSRPLGDALAEGGAPDAWTRDWGRCVIRFRATTVVRCADGVREVS